MARPHPALIELAAGRRPPPSVPDPDELVRSAVEHRMHGLLWSAVERGEIDVPLAAEKRLGVLFLRTREHHRRLWAALEEVTSLLADRGIEVATFKGVTAERRWYDRMGERPSRDLDLWLSPHQLDRAEEVVRLLHPNHPLVNDIQQLVDRRQLQSVDLAVAGVAVDLHFDPLKLGVWTPHLQTIWERTTHVSGFRTLGETDAAIQLLTHLVKDRFSWLIGMADVPKLLTSQRILCFVVNQAEAAGLERILYGAIWAISQHLLLSPPLAPQRPPRVWRILWHDALRANGLDGFLRSNRRQHLIPLFIRNTSLPTLAEFYWRLLFPASSLLKYRHPDVSGPYLARAIVGRVRRQREHWALRRDTTRRRAESPSLDS